MSDNNQLKYVGYTLAKTFKEKIEANKSAIQTEADTRIAGDSNLQTQITTVSAALQSETNTRSENDSTLQANIDATNTALKTETETRISSDNTLQANIDAANEAIKSEAETRSSGDATLQSNIDAANEAIKAEAETRAEEDGTLLTKINDNKTLIENEIENRVSADNDLQTQINTINSAQNCVDIVKTKEDLEALDVSNLELNDKVEVLVDSGEYEGKATIYNLDAKEGSVGTWSLVGPMGTYAMSSWKDWSVDHDSSGVDEDVYIGDTNSASDYSKIVETLSCDESTPSSVTIDLAKSQPALQSYTWTFDTDDSFCRLCGISDTEGAVESSTGGVLIVRNNNDTATENDYYVALGSTISQGVRQTVGDEECIVTSDYMFKSNEYGTYDGTTYTHVSYLNNIDVTKTVSHVKYRADAYQFGKHNVISNASDSLSEKQSQTTYATATNVGNYNTVNGEGVNIGKKNTANSFGINIGESNTASNGSISIGQSATSDHGSLSYSHTMSGSSADEGSIAIDVQGTPTATKGSMAISMNGKSTATEGSLSIGSNTADCGGIALAIYGATASSNSISIGSNTSSRRGSVSISAIGGATADGGSTAIGYGTNATSSGIALGTSGVSANNGVAIGYKGSTTTNGGIAVGLEGVNASYGGVVVGSKTASSSGGSVTLGIEGATSDGASISVGRSKNEAYGGSVSVGTVNNYSSAGSIAIGDSYSTTEQNKAIFRGYAIGHSNTASKCGMSIGTGQIASNAALAIGQNEGLDTVTTVIAYVDTDGSAAGSGEGAGHAYLPNMKLSMSAVKGKWSGSVFTEDSSGTSYAIKTAKGTYYTNCNDALIDSIVEITGTRVSDSLRPSFRMDAQSPYQVSTYVTITDDERTAHIKKIPARKYCNTSINNAITIGSNATAENGAIAILTSNMRTGNCISESITTTQDTESGLILATAITHTYTPSNDYRAFASYNSIAIGEKTQALCGSTALNMNAYSCNASLAIGLGSSSASVTANNASAVIGQSSYVNNASFAFGMSNTAINESFVAGLSNNAYHASFILGNYNTAGTSDDGSSGYNIILGANNTASNHGHGILLGYGNTSMTTVGAYKDPKNNEKVEPFSLVSGAINTSMGRMNFIHGYRNQAGFTNQDTYDNIANNDGLCVAIGRENRAYRNYDMAIGYKAIADGCVTWMTQTNPDTGSTVSAGGQNIAIHASEAHGSTNIAAFNSTVYGISNIGLYDSQMNLTYSDNYSYLCTNRNVLFNSTINMNATASSSFADNTFTRVNLVNSVFAHFDRNTLKDSNLSLSSVTTFVDNIIYGNSKNTDYSNPRIDITNTTSMVGNIIIGNNIISTNSVKTIVDNVMLMSSTPDYSDKYRLSLLNIKYFADNILGFNSTCVIDGTTVTENSSDAGAQNNVLLSTSRINSKALSTCNNFLFSSVLTANTVAYLPKYYTSNYWVPSNGNFLVGTNGTDLSEVISFSYSEVVYDDTSSSDCILNRVQKSFNFGDNDVIFGAEDVLFGYQNKVKSAIHSVVFGDQNTLTGSYGDSIETYMKSIDETVMFGSYNTITATQGSSRINVFGSYNNIVPESMISSTDMLIVGYSNYAYGSTSSLPIKSSDRMTVFGSYNRLGSFTTDGFIFGAYNTVGNTTSDTSDIIYCNMYALGSYNTVKDGSNAMAIGAGNNSTGHHALSLGMQLNTNQFQTVIGKYNKALDGTNRYNTTEDGEYTPVDTTTGALFIVGNGYAEYGNSSTKRTYDWNDETYIHRSNAMVVWANGSVEAQEFIVTVGGKKYKLSDVLSKLDLSDVTPVETDN